MPNKNIILGSGISGISAAYHLKQKGQNSILFEKDSDWGGLCGFFTINGFRFDRFVHFTFTNDDYIKNIFESSSSLYEHPSISYNYYNGFWLKHPAMNNLAELPTDEKVQIIKDFISRPQKEISSIKNYDEWLRVQGGNYFAEHFSFPYTRKYWGQEPKDMETKWIGNRIHIPDLTEVLSGAFESQDKNFYYTSIMRYPKKGGFRSILDKCRDGLDIRFNKKVTQINTEEKIIYFDDNTKESYDNLISSLPLPEIVKMIDGCPNEVLKASENLHWTCGYQISLGFNRPNIPKYLWFYIYDTDILSSRVYSPSLKSQDNVPNNCSSLQAEVFFDCKAKIPSKEVILENTLNNLQKICSFTEKDIIVKDIRFEEYANVTFIKDVYKNRDIILDYLKAKKIKTIGRFGKWDYLWTHQAFESGREICENFSNN